MNGLDVLGIAIAVALIIVALIAQDRAMAQDAAIEDESEGS